MDVLWSEGLHAGVGGVSGGSDGSAASEGVHMVNVGCEDVVLLLLLVTHRRFQDFPSCFCCLFCF